MPPRNQTFRYLRGRLEEIGIRPDSRKGQNFLVDVNLLDLLVRAADVGPDDVVLEVGTGTGGLTARLSDRAAAVVTVEIDNYLYELASEELINCDNVTMLKQDALKNKNRFDPAVIEAIQKQLDAEPGRQFKLVANLPYNIATPVITNLLDCELSPVSLTGTIQKELADRMIAVPSTKDYGSLGIWVQSLCSVEIVRILAPTVFWPQPKVTSAIVHLTVDHARREAIPDLNYFHRFVRAMFMHRRKFLRANLVTAYKEQLSKEAIDEVMAERSLAGDRRSEQLTVTEMLALCESVRSRTPDWKLA